MLAALLGATLTAISVNAQTPTVVHDLFLPWADGDSAPTAASIVDAVSLTPLNCLLSIPYRVLTGLKDPSLTTYAVNFLCRGRWDAMCNYLNGLRSYTFTQGPTVYKDYISYGGV